MVFERMLFEKPVGERQLVADNNKDENNNYSVHAFWGEFQPLLHRLVKSQIFYFQPFPNFELAQM